MSVMIPLGIDVGSLTTKAVILEGDRMLACSVVPSGDEAELSAREAMEQAVARSGLDGAGDFYVVSTGTAGKSVSFARQHKSVTTCLARGIHRLFPSARMGIDMGAETSTVLKVNDRGRINDWVNHDKCAAGTGAFLQQMAKIMQMSLEDMAALHLDGNAGADISSTCAVFAESEVISYVHRDPPTPVDVIVAGIYASVVSRLMTLCKRIGIEKDVAVVGGVALNGGLVGALEKELGFRVLVPEMPQIAAALGAAVVAAENIEKGAR